MDKINWKQKIASRKFWAMLGTLVVAIGTIFGLKDATTTQLVGVISAVGGLVGYMFAEGIADSGR